MHANIAEMYSSIVDLRLLRTAFLLLEYYSIFRWTRRRSSQHTNQRLQRKCYPVHPSLMRCLEVARQLVALITITGNITLIRVVMDFSPLSVWFSLSHTPPALQCWATLLPRFMCRQCFESLISGYGWVIQFCSHLWFAPSDHMGALISTTPFKSAVSLLQHFHSIMSFQDHAPLLQSLLADMMPTSRQIRKGWGEWPSQVDIDNVARTTYRGGLWNSFKVYKDSEPCIR
jgi:hypothetical protein